MWIIYGVLKKNIGNEHYKNYHNFFTILRHKKEEQINKWIKIYIYAQYYIVCVPKKYRLNILFYLFIHFVLVYIKILKNTD